MKSIRSLYKIGHGPSSSHTMGPSYAATRVKELYPNANHFKVVLYGSLALTGKGHLTDRVVIDTLAPNSCEVVFDIKTPTDIHPNTLDFYAYENDTLLGMKRFYSIGGGDIVEEGVQQTKEKDIYTIETFSLTKEYCLKNNISLIDYIKSIEGESILDDMQEVYSVMKASIKRGLATEGVLPGSLKVVRKAKQIYDEPVRDLSANFTRKVFSYAFAVAEENASGGVIVTAPTCGSCGVLPAVLYAFKQEYNEKESRIYEALLVAGLVGNFIRTNASISGAECGCQAEVGAACAMAAAAYAYLTDCSIDQIEQAAEIALEHHLGLTCDPVDGYVQIPCIERNAVCALRAIDSAKLIHFLQGGTNKVTFDMVVKTMLDTGKDLNEKYRETAEGGLAKRFRG